MNKMWTEKQKVRREILITYIINILCGKCAHRRLLRGKCAHRRLMLGGL